MKLFQSGKGDRGDDSFGTGGTVLSVPKFWDKKNRPPCPKS
ncbi:MAG: hypothetical protein HPY66_1600 [Firmicutes bacterium]|nr:hypothetical protein [Bacillota bacterium]